MVFHFGILVEQYSNISVISLIEGVGGNTYVPLAMYSLRMSFCIVPDILFIGTPCSSATTAYIASKTIAGALIVIEVETLSSGIPSSNSLISSSVEIETPTLPTSPSDKGSSASSPSCVGKSNATDRPFCPRSSSKRNRSFVSLADENPAYCRIVHKRVLYMCS